MIFEITVFTLNNNSNLIQVREMDKFNCEILSGSNQLN